MFKILYPLKYLGELLLVFKSLWKFVTMKENWNGVENTMMYHTVNLWDKLSSWDKAYKI